MAETQTFTDQQRLVFRCVAGETREGRWFRARRAGERVTLASLHTRGVLERRAHRKYEGHPDAAYEYRVHPDVLAAARERQQAARLGETMSGVRGV